MSGGVDSSVAALLLKEQGYEVVGLYMLNWEENDAEGFCSSETDFEYVKTTAAKIGIPYYTVNFAKEYLDKVFSHFLYEYEHGRTPNPDVLCNREIKFGAFFDFAMGIGAEFVATGHYCGVEKDARGAKLLKAKDKAKDQSYFLHQLKSRQLEKVLFPLSDMVKTDVRKIAESHGLPAFDRKDSTGICFIGERKFKDFLKNYLPACPGDIVDLSGKKVGRHEGLMYYTIGQRRGLGIGGLSDYDGGRWFVLTKDLKSNLLIVSQGEDDLLFSDGLITGDYSFVSDAPPSKEFRCKAKFRYRQPDQDVLVKVADDRLHIAFDKPQRAVTAGQYAVLYDGEVCLGGGVIDKVIKDGKIIS